MSVVTVLAALLWLITLGCGVSACVALVTALRLQAGGIRVSGRVVAHAEESEGSSVSGVVEYVVDGVSYRVQTQMTVARVRIPIGTPKAVLYIAGDPASGRVVSGRDLFVSTMALSIVTAMVGAAAAGLTVLGAFG